MDVNNMKSQELIDMYNKIENFIDNLNKEENESKQMLENMGKEK